MSANHRGRWTLADLLARADRSAGLDGCWPWTGARFVYGYGKVREGLRFRSTHTLVFERFYGNKPAAVMHICDNPPCINPFHLRGGSLADNTRDMWAKGRAGVAQKLSDLDRDRIVARYRAGERAATLAGEYGVAVSRIYQVLQAAQ